MATRHAVKRKKRKGKLRLTKLGRAFVLVCIAVVTGFFGLLILVTQQKGPTVQVVTGEDGTTEVTNSGIPALEWNAASAQTVAPATPTATPAPSPTPTIKVIATPVPTGAESVTPTPTPNYAQESRIPTQEEIKNAYETVLSNGGVNLRAGCSEDSKIIAEKLKRGAKVKIYAREGDFFFVQLMSTGDYGYISYKFVDAPDYTPVPVATCVPAGAVGGMVASKTLMMRNGPGTDYSEVYDYTKGTQLYVYFLTNGDWYYVEVASTGAKGYMHKDYITVESEPPAGTPVP